MGKIRTIIVDDSQHFREALKQTLETCCDVEIVGEAECGMVALEVICASLPDLVLLDLSLPRISGFDIIQNIRHCSPKSKIIILTMYEGERNIAKAESLGVEGYCFKDEGREGIKQAIEAVMRGERYVSRE